MYTPRNAGVSTPPSRPERPQGYSHPGLGVSPLREKRRLSTGSSFDSSVSFASDRSNPNVNPNHRGSTGGSRVSTERPPAATEEKRRETVKNVLNDMGVSRNKVESDAPPGASREKNQYLLLKYQLFSIYLVFPQRQADQNQFSQVAGDAPQLRLKLLQVSVDSKFG